MKSNGIREESTPSKNHELSADELSNDGLLGEELGQVAGGIIVIGGGLDWKNRKLVNQRPG